MEQLKKKFIEIALPQAAEVKNLLANHSEVVLGQYNIGQVLSGMKGMTGLLTVTSKLDAEEGIRFRGYSIPELQEKLPRKSPDGEPLPEGLFHLMLLGELPSHQDVDYLSSDWQKRSFVPKHVFNVIDSMPMTSNPMTIFSLAILALATESKFQKAHQTGLNKKDYWDTTYEDAMNLIARLPRIASYIYRRLFYRNDQIEPDPYLDWAGNLAHMMGYQSEEVKRLMRLYMVIHADHEGGNVSAHTNHLVSSALSSVYYSYSAGMSGLAGPLHGYANQEVIQWIFDMIREIGEGDNPPREKIISYIYQTLDDGKVVPGYGHAVLRKTDPRFLVLQEFAHKYAPDNSLIRVVDTLYEVVPPILGSVGKIKNPWPNVDAYSGSVLLHYGIKEHTFYTVLFGVSRALGVLAQMIWDRAYGLPIERPSSQTLEWFKTKAGV
ncbi:MAG: citrate (Si)-synthase [Bacteroidia bacterium]|nr:citrate (Si)-synthase [Bacteroidia bacterium]